MAKSVAQFNEWLKATRICNNCPMLGKGVFVGCDSATGAIEPQKILFLGLNPGVEEARHGLPFVGPSGKFLRNQLKECGIDSWAIANSLLCSSRNETEILQADKTRACCHNNLARIFCAFLPKVIIPCGNGAWSLFQVRIPITPATEQIFISFGPKGQAEPVLVMPIFHPSALIRTGGSSSSKFPAFANRLKRIAAIANLTSQIGITQTVAKLKADGITVHSCFNK